MVLTAAGVVLAYLVWRRPANPGKRGAQTAPQVNTDGLPAPMADGAGSRSAGQGGGVAPPAPMQQLPGDATWSTGRGAELKHLLAAMPAPEHATAVVISAIDGMGGIGKTTLAVHAAHRMAEDYPDGQLFIDLHGFTEAVAPVEPADALDRLLRAVGVLGERIPVELDDRAALWRSTLAERRMLIVLDNAATEDQVTPLLPGSPGCLVVITSRHRLAGLDATHTVSLDMLPAPDAVTLFDHIAGRAGLAAESPQLVAEAVELCGRLPLAIRIAAARLKGRPTWGVADLIARLRDQQERLAELQAGTRSLTTALALSYRQLTADQQHMYRQLGLNPGPEVEPYMAAALADTTLGQARRLLDQLLNAHLLQEPAAPGRYEFHDLVRAHAGQTVAGEDAEPQRRAALGRLLDHYRHTASVAMDGAHPYERARRPAVPPSGPPTPDLVDPTGAVAWLDVELPNLLAAARHAAAGGWPEHTWHLSTILHRHLRTRGRYRDAEALHHRALTTARTTGNRGGELDALTGLGHIHRMQGRYEQAIDHYGHALEIARITGNRGGELDALLGLGHIHLTRGRYEQAIEHFEPALEIARSTGNRGGELDALLDLGHIHLLQAQHEQATEHFEPALEIARTTGNRTGELNALTGLGHIHRLRGRHDQAANRYQLVLDLAREIGDRNWQFEALQGFGRLHQATGQPDLALAQHQQALELATDLLQPENRARAHDSLAHAHHALNHPEHARQHWQDALDILTDLGTDYTEDQEANVPTIRTHLINLNQQHGPPASHA